MSSMLRHTRRKMLSLLLELQSRGISLVQPNVVRSYFLAYEPDIFFSYDSARRNVRRNLTELAELGLLRRYKLSNKRTVYKLTDAGIKVAKEL